MSEKDAGCQHHFLQGRDGHSGTWCKDCGTKIYDVECQECQGCQFFSRIVGGSICKKHLMGVTPDMHVYFKISEGSCWTAKESSDD